MCKSRSQEDLANLRCRVRKNDGEPILRPYLVSKGGSADGKDGWTALIVNLGGAGEWARSGAVDGLRQDRFVAVARRGRIFATLKAKFGWSW